MFGLGVIGLVPAYRLAHLPLQIYFHYYLFAYWVMVLVLGPFAALVMAAIAVRFKPQLSAPKIVVVALLCGILIIIKGPILGVVEGISAFAVAEVFLRDFKGASLNLLPPLAYMFLVEIFQGAYNHALAGIRNPQLFDQSLDRLDNRLFHFRASEISHWGVQHLPHWVYGVLDAAYNTWSLRLIGVLLMLSILKGERYALRFMRTVMVCIVLALISYSMVPAKGPYSICPNHAEQFDTTTKSYLIQELLTQRVKMLWAHGLEASQSLAGPDDYYISFPSLHVALPLVAIWFLRPWKRLAVIYSILYAALLLPAILLLEWHYLIDFVGGFVTAPIAIWVAEKASASSRHAPEGIRRAVIVKEVTSVCEGDPAPASIPNAVL